MKKWLILVIAVIMIAPVNVRAEAFKSKKEISPFLKSLSSEMIQGNIKDVFEKLKPYWPIPGQEVDAIVYQLENQRNQVMSRFGKILSMEGVEKSFVGDSFYRETYLVKYERHAMAWEFTFYKPDDKWIVNSVLTSDQLDGLFREK